MRYCHDRPKAGNYSGRNQVGRWWQLLPDSATESTTRGHPEEGEGSTDTGEQPGDGPGTSGVRSEHHHHQDHHPAQREAGTAATGTDQHVSSTG